MRDIGQALWNETRPAPPAAGAIKVWTPKYEPDVSAALRDHLAFVSTTPNSLGSRPAERSLGSPGVGAICVLTINEGMTVNAVEGPAGLVCAWTRRQRLRLPPTHQR